LHTIPFEQTGHPLNAYLFDRAVVGVPAVLGGYAVVAEGKMTLVETFEMDGERI